MVVWAEVGGGKGMLSVSEDQVGKKGGPHDTLLCGFAELQS